MWLHFFFKSFLQKFLSLFFIRCLVIFYISAPQNSAKDTIPHIFQGTSPWPRVCALLCGVAEKRIEGLGGREHNASPIMP